MYSNKTLSRLGGCLYLMVIAGILVDEFYARGNLIVWGDSTVTAQNILANEELFRLGFVVNLIAQACLLLLVLVLYQLLKSVNKLCALFMVACVMVTVSIVSINALNGYNALLLLKGSSSYLSVLTERQIHALTLFYLTSHTTGLDLNFIYAGLWLLPLGYLVWKSGLGVFSRIMGWWLMITCLVWLVAFITRFLSPEFYSTYNIFTITGIIDCSEVVFCFWLLLQGINVKDRTVEK